MLSVIVFACPSIGLADPLFLCSYNRELINIELQCKDDTRINIVNVWGFKSPHIYQCMTDDTATLPEELHGVRKSLWHKLYTNCAGQNHCNFIHYPPFYLKDNTTHGIAIQYKCVPGNFSFL